jgi:hypothetical protein
MSRPARLITVLVETRVYPQRLWIDHFNDGLPGDHSRARLDLARRHHTIDRGHQAQAGSLRAQRLQVGLGARLVFAHGGKRRVRQRQILAARGCAVPRWSACSAYICS